MSPPGRPKGEYRSAQRVGCLMRATLTRAARAGQKALERRPQPEPEPQGAEELLEYAFRICRDMPGLAADLRAAALRHQAGAG